MMPTSCLSAGAQQVAYIANFHKHVSSSLSGRAAGSEVAKQMVDVYLSTRWEGETNERHASRVVSILPPFTPQVAPAAVQCCCIHGGMFISFRVCAHFILLLFYHAI
jgi:hypothetical protein